MTISLLISGGVFFCGIVLSFVLMSNKSSRSWTWREAGILAAFGLALIALSVVMSAFVGWFLSNSFRISPENLTLKSSLGIGIGIGLVLVAAWLLMLERIKK